MDSKEDSVNLGVVSKDCKVRSCRLGAKKPSTLELERAPVFRDRIQCVDRIRYGIFPDGRESIDRLSLVQFGRIEHPALSASDSGSL